MLESYWEWKYWTLFWYLFGMAACYYGYHYDRGLRPNRFSDEVDSWDKDRGAPPFLVYFFWPVIMVMFMVGWLIFGVIYPYLESLKIFEKLHWFVTTPKRMAFYAGRKDYLKRG